MKTALKFLCSIAVLLLMGCGDNQHNEKEAKAANLAPISVSNGDVFVNHKVYGEGDYTLLFVHGWCIDQTYWSEQVDVLKSDYKVVTIDLPGFGGSGTNRENWSIKSYGEDVSAVIDQLRLSNVILIGHSMGGDVILEAALKNQNVIALVGIDNFKEVGSEMSDEVQAEIDGFIGMLRSNFTLIAPAYAEGALFHSSTDSTVRSRVVNDFINSDSVIATSCLEALFEYARVEAEQLSKLNQKLYLINSNSSPINIAGLEATGVGYEVLDIDSVGHYPMIEKPEEFNSLLNETIKNIEKSDSASRM